MKSGVKTNIVSKFSHSTEFGSAAGIDGNEYRTTAQIVTTRVEGLTHHVIAGIYNRMTQNEKGEDGTPVDTGLLRSAWNYGGSGLNSNAFAVREWHKDAIIPKPPAINAETSKLKALTFRKNVTFKVWNNQPYAGIVNDMDQHLQFIERNTLKGISDGYKTALASGSIG